MSEQHSSQNEESSMDDEQIDQQINALTDALKTDSQNFAIYQELISLHRKRGDLDETRLYRQQVQQLYCLPEQMWVEWLKDEIQLVGDDSTKVSELVALIETALAEYHYRKVYKLYLKLILQHKLADKAQVFERALRIWGLDVAKGDSLWQMYANYEAEDKDKRRKIERRRCGVPNEGTEQQFKLYAESGSESDSEKVQRVTDKYYIAVERLAKVKAFDEAFESCLLQMIEESQIAPMLDLLRKKLPKIYDGISAKECFNYVQLYFEKLLPMFTINVQLWMLYLEHTDDYCQDQDEKYRLQRVSLKNCYTSIPLWFGYLSEVEIRAGEEIEQLKEEIDQAKEQVVDEQKCFELDKFWHGALSRQVDKLQKQGSEEKDKVHREHWIKQLRDFYEQRFIELASSEDKNKLTEWLLMQAQTEATRINNGQQLSQLMDVYCKSQGQSLESWLQHINLVKQCDLKAQTFPTQVRTAFKRGVTTFCKQGKEKLAKKWLAFEQQCGTIQSIQACKKAIRKALPQGLTAIEDKPQISVSEVIEECKDDVMSVASRSSKGGQPKHTLFIKNLGESVEEEDLMQLFAKKAPSIQVVSVRLIRDKVDMSKRGIAFVDVATAEMAEQALALNQAQLKGQTILVYVSKKEQDEATTTARTVFLTNIPLTCTETAIRELCQENAPDLEIDEIRLIRDLKGRVKGFAYLQLVKESQIGYAISMLNNAKLQGRAIRAERTKLKTQIQSKTANAIVVTNLSYSVRQEKLELYLNENFGKTRSVSLVLDDHQRSKGFAFVEFESAEACNKAIAAREFKLEGRLALIKPSNRQVTTKRSRPADTEKKNQEDDKERKRDKKKKMKNDLKAMIASAKAEGETTNEREAAQASTSQPKSSSNDAFKNMLFGS